MNLITNKLSLSSGFKGGVSSASEEIYHSPNLLREMVYSDDIPIFNEHMDKLYSGQACSVEYRILTGTDELKWVQSIGIPALNKDNEVNQIDAVVLDITARMVMEEELHRNEQRYKSLFAYNSDAICELDLLGNVLAINPAAENITGERLSIAKEGLSIMNIFGAEYTELMTYYFEKTIGGDSPRYTMTSRHKDGGIAYWDMKNVPVYVNNRIMGAFTIAKDVTVNREVERKLADREAEYRLITDNMKDMMGVLDSNGNFIVASPSCERILGIPVGLIQGTTILEYIHPDDQEYIRDEIEDMFHTKKSKLLRSRFIHSNGSIIHLESLGTLVFSDEGAVENIVLVSRDITKRVKVENELRESEERYRRLIELSPQPMISHRLGTMLYMNPAALNLLGATESDELIGKPITNFIHADYRDRSRKGLRNLVGEEYVGSGGFKIVRLDGQIIETKTIGIYDDITETALILIEDVTERLKMERALQESEERYRRLVELSPIAIAVYKEERITYINPAGAQMLGVEFTGDTLETTLMDWIHPDYHGEAREALDNTLLNGYSLPAEYQLVRSDSHVIDVSILSIYDSRSSSIQLMVEDITEKKQVAQALLESQELNGRLIELSPEAIVLHSDYKFIFANLSALKLFGVSSQSELIGRSIFETIDPSYAVSVKARLGTIYKQHTTSTPVEQRILRPNGEEIDVEVIASTISYKGQNAGISVFRDIRERKRAERNRKLAEKIIRESEERYFHLQTSLDQFSRDLFGVMKTSQIEQRLLQEVREILQVSNVSLMDVEHNEDELCQIIETDKGYTLKLDENRGKSYLLCIDEKPITLKIASNRVWLETITRYVSVLFDNFLLIEDLTKELEQAASGQVAPTWLLRFLFNLSENERKSLAQDLHDSALQEQIIWYRKLDLLLADRSITGELREQLGQITEGLLDVIYQIRITCNELRPPMLIRDGLIASLETLFEFTQLRTNYRIKFDAEYFNHTLSDDVLVGLYRIVQELLANASKHSYATEVHILLASEGERIRLEYRDNGVGMNLIDAEVSRIGSMGIYGMRERVRSMDGTIQFLSSENNGLAIFISIPA
ncbi:PAS domain S-box protein [Paenibacillus sp. FA6]|uniref:PAS domain S-box protein n=1 Tax=Paenibacillus sp. FA6 TaxID=3413029 RepID=UPI003F6590E2